MLDRDVLHAKTRKCYGIAMDSPSGTKSGRRSGPSSPSPRVRVKVGAGKHSKRVLLQKLVVWTQIESDTSQRIRLGVSIEEFFRRGANRINQTCNSTTGCRSERKRFYCMNPDHLEIMYCGKEENKKQNISKHSTPGVMLPASDKDIDDVRNAIVDAFETFCNRVSSAEDSDVLFSPEDLFSREGVEQRSSVLSLVYDPDNPEDPIVSQATIYVNTARDEGLSILLQ
jgi:hypothetical protein